MNIDATTIYLWQLADGLRLPLCFSGIISGLLLALCALFTPISLVDEWKDDDEKKVLLRKAVKICLSVFSISWAAFVFTPSSKTIAMMVVIPKIADSKVIQQDLPDLYNTALEALKGALKP